MCYSTSERLQRARKLEYQQATRRQRVRRMGEDMVAEVEALKAAQEAITLRRRLQACQWHCAGLRLGEIARRLGVGYERARQLTKQGYAHHTRLYIRGHRMPPNHLVHAKAPFTPRVRRKGEPADFCDFENPGEWIVE
jgi:hypothetical protein